MLNFFRNKNPFRRPQVSSAATPVPVLLPKTAEQTFKEMLLGGDFQGALEFELEHAKKKSIIIEYLNDNKDSLSLDESKIWQLLSAYCAEIINYKSNLADSNFSFMTEYFTAYDSSYEQKVSVSGLMCVASRAVNVSKVWIKFYCSFSSKIKWDDLIAPKYFLENGNKKGPNALWYLAQSGDKDIWSKTTTDFKDKFTSDTLRFSPEDGLYKGQTLLWILFFAGLKIDEDFLDLLTVEDLRAYPPDGMHKNETVLSNITKDKTFELVIKRFHRELNWDDFQVPFNDVNSKLVDYYAQDIQKMSLILQYCSLSGVHLRVLLRNSRLEENLKALVEARLDLAESLERGFVFRNIQYLFADASRADNLGYKYAYYDLGRYLQDNGVLHYAFDAYALVSPDIKDYEAKTLMWAEMAYSEIVQSKTLQDLDLLKTFVDFSLNIEAQDERAHNLQRAATLYYRKLNQLPLFERFAIEPIISPLMLSAMNNSTDKQWCWEALVEQVEHYREVQELTQQVKMLSLECSKTKERASQLEHEKNTLLFAFERIRSDQKHDMKEMDSKTIKPHRT